MSLTPGAKLGPYEITGSIGAGGMGEVYRARDPRLNRTVAIKVLHPSIAADPDLKHRFEREAQAVAALNHPHICAVYDVGQHDRVDYFVMEYVEGESMAARLARLGAGLPPQEAVAYAVQIADALDRAHRAGIVHRDLKPGNIMLTKAGVKLLDFGLAKATAPAFGPSGVTVTTPLTAQGMILGTLQYMAPEQLEGGPIDARTDIWAFGCVLYEMLSGRRPFEGSSQATVIASILKDAPSSIADTPAAPVPPALDRVVRTCLARDPDERWQTARDLKRELQWTADASGGTLAPAAAPAPNVGHRRLHAWVWPTVAAMALLSTASFAALWSAARHQDVTTIEFDVAINELDNPSVAVSPDQRAIAYSDAPPGAPAKLLWVRRIAEAQARPLAGTDRASWPFWSPSGRELAYFANDKLWAVSVEGGKPRPICEANYGVGGTWNQDGTIVFAPAFLGGLLRVSSAGGKPEQVTQLDTSRRESGHLWPVFLPGGDEFLFLVRTVASESARVEMASLSQRSRRVVTDADALVGYSEPWLLFVRTGVLYRQRLDRKAARMLGEAEAVAQDVSFDEGWATANATALGDTVAWVPHRPEKVAARWYDASGRHLADAFTDVDVHDLRLSPDGSTVAIEKRDPAYGADDIWLVDLKRGARTRVTATRGDEDVGPWLPDGAELIYSSDDGGPYAIERRALDGLGAPRVVLLDPQHDWVPRDITRDGRQLLAATDPNDLWLIPVDAPAKRKAWLATNANEEYGRFSPDGQWIAFVWNRSGTYEVHVRAVSGGAAIPVSSGAAGSPRWSPSGRTLYYGTPERGLMSVSLTRNGSQIIAAQPIPVPGISGVLDYDVAPDGRLLVLSQAEIRQPVLRVKVGWR